MPLPRGTFQTCVFALLLPCLPACPPALFSPSAHRPLALCCIGTCHLCLQLHVLPSFFPPSIRNHQPPSTPCLPNKLFRQSTCSILRALIPVAPGTSGPLQLGCGCHHPVNHHPLATRRPKLRIIAIKLVHSRFVLYTKPFIDDKDGRAKTHYFRQRTASPESFHDIACANPFPALRLTSGISSRNANKLTVLRYNSNTQHLIPSTSAFRPGNKFHYGRQGR